MLESQLYLVFGLALVVLSSSFSGALAGDAFIPIASLAAGQTGPQPTVPRAISDAKMMATLKRAAHEIQRRIRHGYVHQYPPLNLSSASAFETNKIPESSSLFLLQKDGKSCLSSSWNLDATFNKNQACWYVGGGPAKDGGWVCYYWVEVHNGCWASVVNVNLNCWDSYNGPFNSQLPVQHLTWPQGGSKNISGYTCRLNTLIMPGETYRFDYLAYGRANSWNNDYGPWNMWVLDAKWLTVKPHH